MHRLVTQCPSIVSLNITGNGEVSDMGARHIESLKNLKELIVEECSNISSEGFSKLFQSLSNLQVVSLSRTKVNDSSFAYIPTTIERIKLKECSFLTDESKTRKILKNF